VEASEDGVSVAAQSKTAISTITVLASPDDVPEEEEEGEEEEKEEQEEEESQEEQTSTDDVEDDDPEIIDTSDNGDPSDAPKKTGSASPNQTGGIDLTQIMGRLITTQQFSNFIETFLPTEELHLQGLDMESLFIKTYERLKNSLDAINKENVEDIQFSKAVVGSAIATTTGLSVGYVVWLIRGGMLLSSVLSSMPAWQIADPLPILAGSKKDDDDDESLEKIIEKGSRNNDEKKDENPEN
jgi:hypothetical protein